MDLLELTIDELDRAIEDLHVLVPAPQKIQFADSFVFRHIEQLPRQVILQKLVKSLTTLRAALLLSTHGFFQEQALLQRVLDEMQEEICFLSMPLIGNEPLTKAHATYIHGFFLEDIDRETGKPIDSNRPMVPRQKIRAYIANSHFTPNDPSTQINNTKFLSNFYSSYVHGASFTIMDTYGGFPPRFHTNGMNGTPKEESYRRDLLNYFYRSILSFQLASLAFGASDAHNRLSGVATHYVQIPGFV